MCPIDRRSLDAAPTDVHPDNWDRFSLRIRHRVPPDPGWVRPRPSARGRLVVSLEAARATNRGGIPRCSPRVDDRSERPPSGAPCCCLAAACGGSGDDCRRQVALDADVRRTHVESTGTETSTTTPEPGHRRARVHRCARAGALRPRGRGGDGEQELVGVLEGTGSVVDRPQERVLHRDQLRPVRFAVASQLHRARGGRDVRVRRIERRPARRLHTSVAVVVQAGHRRGRQREELSRRRAVCVWPHEQRSIRGEARAVAVLRRRARAVHRQRAGGRLVRLPRSGAPAHARVRQPRPVRRHPRLRRRHRRQVPRHTALTRSSRARPTERARPR